MIYLVFIFLPDFGAPRFNSYLSYANHAWLRALSVAGYATARLRINVKKM